MGAPIVYPNKNNTENTPGEKSGFPKDGNMLENH